jgi:hypothetical protein
MVGGFADRSAISAAPTRRRRQTPLQGKGDDRTQRQTAARGIGTQLRQHVARNLERRRHRRFADRYDMGNRPCVLQIPIRLPPRNATLLSQYGCCFRHADPTRQQAMRRVQVQGLLRLR